MINWCSFVLGHHASKTLFIFNINTAHEKTWPQSIYISGIIQFLIVPLCSMTKQTEHYFKKCIYRDFCLQTIYISFVIQSFLLVLLCSMTWRTAHYLLKNKAPHWKKMVFLNYLYQFHNPFINCGFVFYHRAISLRSWTHRVVFKDLLCLYDPKHINQVFIYIFLKSSLALATQYFRYYEKLSSIIMQPLNYFEHNYTGPQRTITD